MVADIQTFERYTAAIQEPATIESLCEPNAFPATLDDRAKLARRLGARDQYMMVATAIFLASTRDTFFPAMEQAGEFMAWVLESFGGNISPSHVHHLVAVGRMLIANRERPSVATTLSKLDFDKLLAITRVPREKLLRFIEQYGPALDGSSREKVRKMVDEFAPPDKIRKPPKPAYNPTPIEVVHRLAEIPPHRIYETADAIESGDALNLLKRALDISERRVDQLTYNKAEYIDMIQAVTHWMERVASVDAKFDVKLT